MEVNTELEQLRTFGLLSETPQYIDMGPGKRYVTLGGYMFTYSTFSTLFMWTICGPAIYLHIWKEQEDSINTLKNLNKNDKTLQDLDDDAVAYYFINKIKSLLVPNTPENFEKVIKNMFESSHLNS